MKSAEELEKAIRDSLDSLGLAHESTGKIGADMGMNDVDVGDLIFHLEERLEFPCDIDMDEDEILKMTVVEFAVALHAYLEEQEG